MKKFTLAAALIALTIADPLIAQTTVNVRDADIRAFIADAARVTGRTFIIDSRVQGKVTVVNDRPLSRSEYFELFLSTLRANGFVAVPTTNGAFRIQPIDGAAAQPSRVGSAGANRNQFVTEIIRLRSIDASQAIDSVRSLVSPQGSVSANRGSNSIVVVDFADNVRRVREVLRQLDTDGAASRIVALQNASAKEIATALTALISGGQAGGAGAGTSNAAVVAIDSSNAVAIRGDAATVARLTALAQDLDRKARSGQEIRVVFLENADAAQLLPVLQQLVGQPVTQPPEMQGLSPAGNIGGSSSTNGATTTTTTAPVASAPVTTTTTAGTGTPAIVGVGGRSASVITRFAGANAIVIAGPAEVQRQLAEVIAKLDTRREQVLVEAIVAEVSDTTASKLGVQFLLSGLGGSNLPFASTTYSNSAPNLLTIAGAIGSRSLGNTTTITSNGTTTTTTTGNTANDSLTQAAISSIIGANGGLFGFGGKLGSDAVFGGIVNAVKSDTTSNLLQSPSITVIDNTEARILVGQEVPVTTGQALSNNFDNTFRTTQRENVGIQLQVRPQINSSGSIKLFIRQQVSSIAGPVSSDNSDLVFNKREIETVQTVDDGQIAVIAGLLSDEERRTIEKIPLLGDIPVLGNLFKSRGKSRTKTNLMVFIRATILKTPADLRRITEQRYGVLRLQQAGQRPDQEPSIDQLVRDYMGATPPIPSAPIPGNIEDPRIAVPTMGAAPTTAKRRKK